MKEINLFDTLYKVLVLFALACIFINLQKEGTKEEYNVTEIEQRIEAIKLTALADSLEHDAVMKSMENFKREYRNKQEFEIEKGFIVDDAQTRNPEPNKEVLER